MRGREESCMDGIRVHVKIDSEVKSKLFGMDKSKNSRRRK